MRMPVISARAHIYATECKRRTPRLTVIPHDTRHLLLQHVARAGVRLRAPTRRKPVNNARVAGQEGRRHSAIASVARTVALAVSRSLFSALAPTLSSHRLAGCLGRPLLPDGGTRRVRPSRLTLVALAWRPLPPQLPF